MKAVYLSIMRPLMEAHLPPGLDVTWCDTLDAVLAAMPDADIVWADYPDGRKMYSLVSAGKKLQWLSTIYAGLDSFPVQQLIDQRTLVTNGVGINTVAVAEYAVMGMLSLAKNYPQVVRSADRGEWLLASPGNAELEGTKALIVGYGAIGQAIGHRLAAFDVEITGVARTARPETGVLGQGEWQARVGEFDWIILATPSTDDTKALLGAEEIAGMKSSAYLVNIARGACVDQEALIATLQAKRIAGAFLDVTTPEPLPPEHILWKLPNAQVSMHLSARAQSRMVQRAVALYLDNLDRYRNGREMRNVVDLRLGY